MNHTFANSGKPPSPLQRGLDDYDRDTIAYLAMCGAGEAMLERVLRFSGARPQSGSGSFSATFAR